MAVNNEITIKLQIDATDVSMLANELEKTDSSELTIFIEKILKVVETTTEKLGENITAINVANPFSHVNKETVK